MSRAWSRVLFVVALVTSGGLAIPSAARAACLDQPGDVADIAAARAQIEGSCVCSNFDGSKGKKRLDYIRCGRQILAARVASSQLRKACAKPVETFYHAAACGYPPEQFMAPCIVTNATKVGVRCTIDRQDRCHGFVAPFDRVACFSSPICIDVADTNGDLSIGAPGDSGGCVPPNLTDNGDGTITDLDTNLMWEKKSDDAGLYDSDVMIHDKDNLYFWHPGPGSIFEWIDKVNAENGTGFANHNDWRIPTIDELKTLIRRDVSDPAIASDFNTGCTPGCNVLSCSCTASLGYWSSTERSLFPTPPGNPTTAWGIDFFAGDVGFADFTALWQVRAVRTP